MSGDISKSEYFIKKKLKENIFSLQLPNYHASTEPNPEAELIEDQLDIENINKLIECHKELKSEAYADKKEEVPAEVKQTRVQRPSKKVSPKANTQEKEASILPFIATYFEKLRQYRYSYFPDLDERVFFEFLLYRSDYNIRNDKCPKSPISYSDVKKNTFIKTDKQKKLLKEFKNRYLISVTNDGYNGAKQVKVNYDFIIENFEKIYNTDEEDISDRERERLKELKIYLRSLSKFI